MKRNPITAKKIFLRLYYTALVIPKLALYLGYIPLAPISLCWWIITGLDLNLKYDSVIDRLEDYRSKKIWRALVDAMCTP
jgi:hypothetical protein